MLFLWQLYALVPIAHFVACHQTESIQLAVYADYDILIAAGGDGTINQVANELVKRDAPSETCIGVIPLGTANDLATSLGIRDDNLVQAMQTAVKGHCSLLLLQATYVLLVASTACRTMMLACLHHLFNLQQQYLAANL